MTIYTDFTEIAYAKEAIFGTSVIDGVGDTAYLWGATSRESELRLSTSMNWRAVGAGAKEVPAGNAWKKQNNVSALLGLVVQNGILFWAAMGKSTTAGAGPYTHTIIPTDDGTLLPSFTLNAERSGTATDFPAQVTGAKVARLRLAYDLAEPAMLLCEANFMCKKLQDGIMLTTSPALPATASTAPYTSLTREFNSVSIDGLTEVEVTIDNGLMAHFAHTWDTGVYTGMWCQSISEAARKDYQVILRYHPSTIEDDLFDEAVTTGNTKDLILKWSRSVTDYIQLTFSDCHVIDYPFTVPAQGETLLDEVTLYPERLSVEVKDSIAGGSYGE